MDWIALLGALGVGALVSTWVSNSRERRLARSRAREAIANVEHLRWAPQDPDARAEQAKDLWQARRDLAVAAMIAGLPRGITEEYIRLAAVSWKATSDHWDSHGRGGMDGTTAQHIEEARNLMVDLSWQPRRTNAKKRMATLEGRKRAIIETDPTSHLRWKYETP